MRIGLRPMLSVRPVAGQEKFGPKRRELDISSRPGGLPVVPDWLVPIHTHIALPMHSPPHAALSERSAQMREMPGAAHQPAADHGRWLTRLRGTIRTRRGIAPSSQMFGCDGIPKDSGCRVFGRDALPEAAAARAARRTLNGLSGHRDPVHVREDIPITVGVAVVTRLAIESRPPCLAARTGKPAPPGAESSLSTQPFRSTRDRWSARGSALHRPIFQLHRGVPLLMTGLRFPHNSAPQASSGLKGVVSGVGRC